MKSLWQIYRTNDCQLGGGMWYGIMRLRDVDKPFSAENFEHKNLYTRSMEDAQRAADKLNREVWREIQKQRAEEKE